MQLSYACVGDPFPPPSPAASSFYSSLATPAAPVGVHLLVSLVSHDFHLSSSLGDDVPEPNELSSLRNQNFLRSNDP